MSTREQYLPVEFGTIVTEAVLASAELAEILRSYGDSLIIQLEGDTAGWVPADLDVELQHERERWEPER